MSGVTYGPDQPLRIIALERTCRAHPSQWQGESEHHAPISIRCRDGELTVVLERDWCAGFDDLLVWDNLDMPLPTEWGVPELTFAQLRAVLPDWIMISDGVQAEQQEGDDDGE